MVVVDLVNLHLVVETGGTYGNAGGNGTGSGPAFGGGGGGASEAGNTPLKDMVEMDHQMFIDMDQVNPITYAGGGGGGKEDGSAPNSLLPVLVAEDGGGGRGDSRKQPVSTYHF